jgi:kynurenine formamidase
MLIDVTLPMQEGMIFRKGSSPLMIQRSTFYSEEEGHYSMSVLSTPLHIGTHIDLVDCTSEIAPERFIGRGMLFDITHAEPQKPVSLDMIEGIELAPKNSFVFFRTGWDRYIGEEQYFNHPEVSFEVLKFLAHHKINMVGIDALGFGMGENHELYDKYLCEHDIFAIENLYGLNRIKHGEFTVYCFPLKLPGVEALPTRILIEQ